MLKTLLITLIPLAGFVALLGLLWRHLRAERRARDGADAFAGTHAGGARADGCAPDASADCGGDGGGGGGD